jgi:hypothetical protein
MQITCLFVHKQKTLIYKMEADYESGNLWSSGKLLSTYQILSKFFALNLQPLLAHTRFKTNSMGLVKVKNKAIPVTGRGDP